MRNYKLNTLSTWGALSRQNEFSLCLHDALLNRGYQFSSLTRQYRKWVCGFTELVLDLGRKELLFYHNRFFMPCELNHYVDEKSEDMKKIKDEVKWLKEQGAFVQKK